MSESLNQHEPTPQPSDHPAAWDLVLADINERDCIGAAKYGTRLQPFNGRNFIKDAYQEALDLTVYLRGAIYEIETLRAIIAELERQLAAAKEDTADLDFLLNLTDRYRFSVWLTRDGVKKYELWLVNGPLMQSQSFVGETEREAIRAARKEAK